MFFAATDREGDTPKVACEVCSALSGQQGAGVRKAGAGGEPPLDVLLAVRPTRHARFGGEPAMSRALSRGE